MVGRGDAKSSLKSRLTTAVPELADADKAVLDRLRKGEVDVLVGTQMVTKGHDIAGVSLVGVVLAVGLARGLAPRFQPSLEEALGIAPELASGLAWFVLFVAGLVVATIPLDGAPREGELAESGTERDERPADGPGGGHNSAQHLRW
mgnify:CR=1 FL=1